MTFNQSKGLGYSTLGLTRPKSMQLMKDQGTNETCYWDEMVSGFSKLMR